MPVYQLKYEQEINSDLDTIWNFIATPDNLRKITPPEMDFNVVSTQLSETMYEGMMIQYTVRPLFGIKTTWLTEITHIRPSQFFVDEQRAGPYRIWHHEHHVKQTESGVLMTDLITYQPPGGVLGKIANNLIIENQINSIFNFRRKVIEDLF